MLPFSERHGFVETPQQLKLGRVSKPFRLGVWGVIFESLSNTSFRMNRTGPLRVSHEWHDFLKAWHNKVDQIPVDEVRYHFDKAVPKIKDLGLSAKVYQ